MSPNTFYTNYPDHPFNSNSNPNQDGYIPFLYFEFYFVYLKSDLSVWIMLRCLAQFDVYCPMLHTFGTSAMVL